MHVLWQVGLVALGSAVGGVLRWTVGVAATRWCGPKWPCGTLVVNLGGCLLLGWVGELLLQRQAGALLGWLRAADVRLFVVVGFTGALTTFSAYEWEANHLLRHGHTLGGMVYLTASVLLGLLALRLGIYLARAG